MSLFIANAYATGQAGAGDGMYGSLLMMVGLVVIFYFLLWRPQNKRNKSHQNLLASLAKGDEVVANGILGTIETVKDDFVILKVSDTLMLTVQKSTITSALPKGTIKSLA